MRRTPARASRLRHGTAVFRGLMLEIEAKNATQQDRELESCWIDRRSRCAPRRSPLAFARRPRPEHPPHAPPRRHARTRPAFVRPHMLTRCVCSRRSAMAAQLKALGGALAGMSAPQMLLVGGVGAGMVSWRYSSAAKLNDHMETQVYVRSPSVPPAVRRKGPRRDTVGKRAG